VFGEYTLPEKKSRSEEEGVGVKNFHSLNIG